jgi:hypothetical protein
MLAMPERLSLPQKTKSMQDGFFVHAEPEDSQNIILPKNKK